MEPGLAPGSFFDGADEGGRQMKPIAGPSASLIAIALTACTPMGREQIETGADHDRERRGTEVATEASGSHAMQPMLDQIRADAAQRVGVTPDKVKILAVEAVTWADGSLGCPEPGMMYAQALVRGYRIAVDAAGTTLDYHAGPQSRFVHCPPERAQPPSPMDPT